MDLFQSISTQRQYNRMRDRLIDLSREYSFEDIVRIERLGFKRPGPEEPVARQTMKWAVGTSLSKEELDSHIRRVIQQLDVGGVQALSGDFIIGASWGDGCGDADENRASRSFTDVQALADFYAEMEREGRNPEHHNQHGPGGWVVDYDERDE